MTYPATTTYPDKYTDDMNATDYVYPAMHSRPAGINHQESTFRWPNGSGNNERTSMFNHTQYLQEKVGPSRNDIRYADLRYQYDPRARHDVAVLHEEQQRLHEFHSQQFQRSTHELRGTQPLNEMRFLSNDIRHPFAKKVLHESNAHDSNAHEIRLPFDEVHMGHDKPVFTPPIDARHSSGNVDYPLPTAPVVRPSFSDVRPNFNETRYHFNNQTDNRAIPSIPMNNSPPYLEPMEKTHEITRPNNQTLTEESHTRPDNDTSPLTTPESSTSLKPETGDKSGGLLTTSPPDLLNKEVSESESTREYLTLLKQDDQQHDQGEQLKDQQQRGSTEQSIIPKQTPDILETKKKEENIGSKENSDQSDNSPTEDGKSAKNGVTDNGLPSYTAMIAQAILKKDGNKSTLSDIYEFMEKSFPSLERRGTGWRNCVRHTLSLNDCFIKLHRPENGRSCNWAVHPSYFESFSRGDYRKRRALRKRPRGLQWIDPIMLGGYPFMREHELHPEIGQQQSSYYHYPPVPGMWGSPQSSYNASVSQTPPPPSHLQHFPQAPPPNIHSTYPGNGNHTGQLQSNHCTNPDCYCQFNKNNCRVYTP